MAWICIDGIDRSGKSTIAEMYKQKGYEVVHLSAPDKKYFKDGYTGPSYFDEMLALYMKYDNKNVVFDRTIYGELVWPHIFSRTSMLPEEDMEYLIDYENNNDVERYYIYDEDEKAHWERCVKDKEKITHAEFRAAKLLYETVLVKQYGFVPKQLSDFADISKLEQSEPQPIPTTPKVKDSSVEKKEVVRRPTSQQKKLEYANAIDKILKNKIIKFKGEAFEYLENKLRKFLNEELGILLGGEATSSTLSPEEITILKIYCKAIKDRQDGQK